MSSIMENERQTLHTRLLDAVKACQTHLAGRNEMVTEASSWVSCLCTQIEAVLQHQLKSPTKGLSITALRQAAVGPGFEEITFWQFVKHHLTKHEVERFECLSNITTELGRGRAWIRSSLNEHSLDRYFLILLSDSVILKNFYEHDAFLLDEEKSSTLIQMAAGLGTIYFNIKINDSALNGSLKSNLPQSSRFIPNLISSSVNIISKEEKPVDEEILEAHCTEKPKKRIGKKKKAKIISFGDDDDQDVTLQGSVKPAERGGPGFVVMKQPLSKSTNSLASDSSSGMLSSDGQLHGNDQHSHKEIIVQRSKIETVAMPETPNLGNGESPPTDQDIVKEIKEINLHSPETLNDSQLKSQSTDVTIITSTPEKLDKSNASNKDLSEVTRHLMSVRHPSGLGSHDLVMDDWSVRSSSVPNTPIVETAPLELHPMQDDYDETMSSDSKSDALQNDSTSSASYVLSFARKSPNENWKRNSSDALLENNDNEAMNVGEMREALVALMHRKTELTETNKSTRSLLDSEMELSAGLRKEIEKLELDLKRRKEEMTTMQQQHIRENEVLRNQLKKYVRAVQALQRGDSNVELPSELPRVNASESTINPAESEVYEQKLVEVAEMHGELMEFNERLHVRLQSALSLLHNMKTELVDLRGPMPNDDLINRIENDNISGTVDSSPPLSRALINIWIPSAFLKGKGANTHHVFQVYVRIGDEEWNIYRRYSQFHDLHLQLRKKYVVLDTYGFPPKKVMGNKGEKFVEDRRKGLQLYLRLLMNNVVQNHEKIVAKPNKETLTKLLPFFSESLDIPDQTPNKKQKRSRRTAQ